MIEPKHPELTVSQQCELIDLPHSTYYHKAKPESEYNQKLMHLIDEEFARHPFLGTRRMREYLRGLGHQVNRKRVQNLYHKLNLAAIFPKKNLSQPNKEHKIYPYLLRDVDITQVNHVWSTDITYLRLPSGFVYLTAIIDWFSRYILDWKISITLEADFCIETVASALLHNTPNIFNVDQGAQFTAYEFVKQLLDANIKVSMDGKGRALDNVFIERFWRSIKYEWLLLQDIQTVLQMNEQVRYYINYYNFQRHHQSLNYQTPAAVFKQGGGIIIPDNNCFIN